MDEKAKKIIDHWLERAHGREIVLVIGAGMSKNAVIKETNDSAAGIIPLWQDIIQLLKKKMNITYFDDLFIFDLYKEFYGKSEYENILLHSMDDDKIVPGAVHKVLSQMPFVKYIITTNNLDTLLDKTFVNANRIIFDTDVSRLEADKPSIIYLHGYRNHSSTWVFSRTDYEDLNTKFPVKTSLTKDVLATFPALFLGFGHTDPNLHSILRFVDKHMEGYKPPMLSLTVSNQNDALTKYWNSMGLEIVSVCRPDHMVEEGLKEAINYISKTKLKQTLVANKVFSKYKIGESYMDILKKTSLSCKKQRNTVFLCEYHKSRAGAEIVRLSDHAGVISVSPYIVRIEKDGEVMNLLQRMQKGFQPAGSWGLMESHRSWLESYFSKYAEGKSAVKVLITGIAGLPHLVDTVSILFNACEKKGIDIKIELYVVDICIGPLEHIKKFVKGRNGNYKGPDRQFYVEVAEYIKTGRLKMITCHQDFLNINNTFENFFDIILSHHLVTFWGEENNYKIKKYMAVSHKVLKNCGVLISAQNVGTDDNSIMAFQSMMDMAGLSVVDSKVVFDIYDAVSTAEPIGDTFYEHKETLLAVHRKETL